MWTLIQLAAKVPQTIPEADYFLRAIDTPFHYNLFRLILAGSAILMLAGIAYYGRK